MDLLVERVPEFITVLLAAPPQVLHQLLQLLDTVCHPTIALEVLLVLLTLLLTFLDALGVHHVDLEAKVLLEAFNLRIQISLCLLYLLLDRLLEGSDLLLRDLGVLLLSLQDTLFQYSELCLTEHSHSLLQVVTAENLVHDRGWLVIDLFLERIHLERILLLVLLHHLLDCFLELVDLLHELLLLKIVLL